jgi:hypothetical protein
LKKLFLIVNGTSKKCAEQFDTVPKYMHTTKSTLL